MRNSSQKRKRAQMMSALKQIYTREFVALSDYIYYSLIFEEREGEISALFNSLAERQIEIFKSVGRLLCGMGVSPALNTQLRQLSSHDEKIEEIFLKEAENKRNIIEELTKLIIISDDKSMDSDLCFVVNRERDILEIYERILRS